MLKERSAHESTDRLYPPKQQAGRCSGGGKKGTEGWGGGHRGCRGTATSCFLPRLPARIQPGLCKTPKMAHLSPQTTSPLPTVVCEQLPALCRPQNMVLPPVPPPHHGLRPSPRYPVAKLPAPGLSRHRHEGQQPRVYCSELCLLTTCPRNLALSRPPMLGSSTLSS